MQRNGRTYMNELDRYLQPQLDFPDQQLWAEYARLRDIGLRTQALETIQKIVDSIEHYNSDRLASIVFVFCTNLLNRTAASEFRAYEAYSRKVTYSIPYPLFLAVILPQLQIGYQNRMFLYARWIAQFGSKIDNLRPKSLEILGINDYQSFDYLTEATRLYPEDKVARDFLISYYEEAFDVYVHEVPTGLLAKSDVFRNELDEFSRLVREAGQYEQYEEQIAKWRFACETWAQYLTRRPEFVNYAEYLKREYQIEY